MKHDYIDCELTQSDMEEILLTLHCYFKAILADLPSVFCYIVRLKPIQFLALVKRQKIQFLDLLWVLVLKLLAIGLGKLHLSLHVQ